MGVKLISKRESGLVTFDQLEAGRLAVVVESKVSPNYIGCIVVKVYDKDMVQMIGRADKWSQTLRNMDYKCRYLEPGELIEITE